MLGTPYHYRDGRNQRGVEATHAVVDHAELYTRNGLQFLPFNTVYQLMAEGDRVTLADGLLMIPDLLAYWLTGVRAAELTNASTTGLSARDSAAWDTELLERLGLPVGAVPAAGRRRHDHRLAHPGGGRRRRRDPAGAGHRGGLPRHRVRRRRRAGAATESAYISCGTWALAGLELRRPDPHRGAPVAGFTNEGGVDGRVRFLHNVMGLWLLSESLRDWESGGMPADLPTPARGGGRGRGPGRALRPRRPGLPAPGGWSAGSPGLRRGAPAGAGVPRRDGARILESLAAAFARTLEAAGSLSGRRLTVVHMVGGGARTPCSASSPPSARAAGAGRPRRGDRDR